MLTDELSKISREKGHALSLQKEDKEKISILGTELEDKTTSLHKMKTSLDYVTTKLDATNKHVIELKTIYEKVKKENSDLNEELKVVKEESNQKTNKIIQLETLNKQLTMNAIPK